MVAYAIGTYLLAIRVRCPVVHQLPQIGALVVHTGNLPIDSNSVENAIRPIALGKKNWLFAGSERAAAIQSLFATAKLNGIEPAAWIK